MSVPVVSRPGEGEIEDTLRCAFGHLSPQERDVRVEAILASFRDGQASPDGLLQARVDDRRIGGLYAQYRPDGTVFLWMPTVLPGFSAEPFFGPLREFCLRHRAAAALILADRGQIFDETVVTGSGGFEYLSDLLYLVARLETEEDFEGETSLEFQPLSETSPGDVDRLVRLVETTYRQTRDFPKLLGALSVEGVLEGYRTGTPFDPGLWFFVRKENRDIGTLLLSDFPPDQIELTYMGLIPSERGRGHGGEIVRFALDEATRRDRSYLLTSVDEQNTAALRAYLSRGFQAWDRKKVFARFFDQM